MKASHLFALVVVVVTAILIAGFVSSNYNRNRAKQQLAKCRQEVQQPVYVGKLVWPNERGKGDFWGKEHHCRRFDLRFEGGVIITVWEKPGEHFDVWKIGGWYAVTKRVCVSDLWVPSVGDHLTVREATPEEIHSSTLLHQSVPPSP